MLRQRRLASGPSQNRADREPGVDAGHVDPHRAAARGSGQMVDEQRQGGRKGDRAGRALDQPQGEQETLRASGGHRGRDQREPEGPEDEELRRPRRSATRPSGKSSAAAGSM